ncbi:hypothetical protein TNCV_650551 [Trichonephila clavipes]|nr:hypothetical protein TNCV_650551 [Trichonephila clavipes]
MHVWVSGPTKMPTDVDVRRSDVTAPYALIKAITTKCGLYWETLLNYYNYSTGENSPLNLNCSAPLSSPHTLDESPLLRILMLLQNVLSLGSKEEMTSRFGKTPT